VNQQSLELARQAVALLRDALHGRAELHSLHSHADADGILRDLTEMDTALANQLGDRLMKDVDFDRFDWTT
jgi:hypothetical protein